MLGCLSCLLSSALMQRERYLLPEHAGAAVGGPKPASDLEASVPSKQAASQDDRLSGLDGKDLEHHCRTMLQLPEHSPGGPALRRYPHRADHQHIFVAGKFWTLQEAGGETAARTDGSNLYE